MECRIKSGNDEVMKRRKASVNSGTSAASKVPEVTLVFWVIKIAATTLGETAGDAVTMTFDWGYLAGSVLFIALLIVLVAWQIAAKRFHRVLYWATIVASTTAGTALADFADRSLGVGYAGGAALLFAALMATLGAWYWALGSISVATVSAPKAEAFYWLAITVSQTLGTALGDWTADDTGLGYEGAALVLPRGWPRSPHSISGAISRGCFCSGPPSFSRGRWARRSATFSTSRSPMAGWPSAARLPLRSSAPLLFYALSSCRSAPASIRRILEHWQTLPRTNPELGRHSG
jgi:hypothetical protein